MHRHRHPIEEPRLDTTRRKFAAFSLVEQDARQVGEFIAIPIERLAAEPTTTIRRQQLLERCL